MKDSDESILQLLIANDSARGLYGPDIQAALGMRSGTLSPHTSRLERDGLIEHRWQEEEIWPISGRDAEVVPPRPDQPARRSYYRALPGARTTLAEHRQAKARVTQQPGGYPQPATS